jgi:polyisoprenoid-binding protein YceI
VKLATILTVFVTSVVSSTAQPRAIDTAKSVMTVHVSKSGVLSAFGHDHQIVAPISAGTVDATAHKVELHVKAPSLKVEDKEGSDKDKAQIQSTMLGPEVLDAERHPEIAFRSTTAEQAGAGTWTVNGNLTLHGQTHAVTVTVREAEGHYTGSAHFKQSDFAIKPVKVAGGTVSVKDEIRIDFEIHLAR